MTGALTDRYCIWSGGKLFSHTSLDDSASLSPQPLLSCGEPDGACNGGNAGHAWEYMQANGTLTCRRQQTQYGVTCDSGCAPYQSASCGEGGDPFNDGCAECTRNVCNDGGGTPVDWTPELWANTTEDSDAPHMVFYAETVGSVGSGQSPDAPRPKPGDKPKKPKPDVERIQTEIMTNGPVSTCFRFYESFHTFFAENPAGIYNTTGMCKNTRAPHRRHSMISGDISDILDCGCFRIQAKTRRPARRRRARRWADTALRSSAGATMRFLRLITGS